jgi:hypothetical protein
LSPLLVALPCHFDRRAGKGGKSYQAGHCPGPFEPDSKGPRQCSLTTESQWPHLTAALLRCRDQPLRGVTDCTGAPCPYHPHPALAGFRAGPQPPLPPPLKPSTFVNFRALLFGKACRSWESERGAPGQSAKNACRRFFVHPSLPAVGWAPGRAAGLTPQQHGCNCRCNLYNL